MSRFVVPVGFTHDYSTATSQPNLISQDLEMECLKTYSTLLPEMGLALLKFVSSHRGLTYVRHGGDLYF